jgi:hypothetical protein
LGINSSLDSFFNIHAGLGFTLILVALFLAVIVNLLGGTGLKFGSATAAGPAPPSSDSSAWPGPPSGGAPPPSAPPPSFSPPSSAPPPTG